MSCCNVIGFSIGLPSMLRSYNTARGMSCCNEANEWRKLYETLQYRKRYELLQLYDPELCKSIQAGYNTASGMSCCNESVHGKRKSFRLCYNTASGMSCCNVAEEQGDIRFETQSYNTASGMSCCNTVIHL